jgi:predicted nucleic acid-binding protein
MTKTDTFFDTNVLVYAFSDDPAFAERSLSLLQDGGIISVQVLNELTHTLRRKFSAGWPQLAQASERMRELCAVVPVTEETHVRGLALGRRYTLSVYDGMIVAAAQLAGCRLLYSEGMHDGLVIDKLTIRNPYAAGGP